MSVYTIHKSKDGNNCDFAEDNAVDVACSTVSKGGKGKSKGNATGLVAGKAEKVIERKFTHSKRQTIFFDNPPTIISGASVVGKKESQGPLGSYFSTVEWDAKMGESSFEAAEVKMLEKSIRNAVDESDIALKDIELLVSGDLINQITTSAYTARNLNIPFLGVYNACSTMTESLAIGASFINAGNFSSVACASVSHFATAERQYRYPLEYGAQRPPYAQWTVTGAGATVLSSSGKGPKITSAIIGRVIDFGITDLSNLGAAMAPAAADSLLALFNDTETSVEDYDLILTGDLGKLGSDILRDLMREQGYELGQIYKDCGAMIYDVTQNCYQGGSGAGCSAAVFNSYFLKKINEGVYKNIIFLATGALMSTQSCYQGETIPAISHGVIIKG